MASQETLRRMRIIRERLQAKIELAKLFRRGRLSRSVARAFDEAEARALAPRPLVTKRGRRTPLGRAVYPLESAAVNSQLLWVVDR